MFNDLVVSSAAPRPTLRRWTIVLSAIGQSLAVGVPILIPLLYTEALPRAVLRMTFVAPAQVARPAARGPEAIPTQPGFVPPIRVVAPTIPSRTRATDPGGPPVLEVGDGIAGTAGTTLSDLIRPLATPAPPPLAEPPQRIHRGGAVEAALLLGQVLPQYPAIAKTARVSGTIILRAIIATDGSVQALTYISGPPLLMKAAMDTVRQWRYRPTLLNGEPVEVETTIEVVFHLGG